MNAGGAKIFGEHDAATIAQIDRCLAAGGERGVLCAKGRFVKVGGKRVRTEGLVRHDEMMKWIAEKGVVLRGGDLDETPQAYRRLPGVLDAHAGTIRLLHALTPLGVAMAGKDYRRSQ